MLDKEEKTKIIQEYGKNEGDTGSTDIQLAILSERVTLLTDHLKAHPHDYHSRRALYKILGKRRRFFSYLKKKDADRYLSLVDKLGIRV